MLPIAPLLLVVAMAGPGADPDGAGPDPAIAADNAHSARQVADRIRGRENEPAATVFRNVRLEWMRTVPAGTFLDIMEGGYARALGVRCTHCHVEGDFASDEKRPKQAAREMAVMHYDINQKLLAMRHLRGSGDERFINCSTCHRGAVDPHDPVP